MIAVVRAGSPEELSLLKSMRERSAETECRIDMTVSAIIEDVKKRGIKAVNEYSLLFDGAEPYIVSKEDIDAAYTACPPELVRAMERAAANIRAYQEKLLPKSMEWSMEGGGMLGQLVRPLERVGLYVPGGTASYPSSVLMNAVPAAAAGVSEIVMATPPTRNLNNAVLAASKIAGVNKVIALGGAQAIAALAFGADFIPRVDKIVGPGNAYVAAAKRMVFGSIDIDMIAGPSEILIIADDSADAAFIAADMLSQAEHDALSSAILATTSEALAHKVAEELEAMLATLPREIIARRSIDDFGAVIICDDLRAACETANSIAPEHLELMIKNPREALPLIKNAGAVFLGPHSPEPLGDYMAGPSHVLPTSGTARFFSPLSVESFLKRMSVIEYPREALKSAAGDIMLMAEHEGLHAHARSVGIRFGREV